MVAMTAMVLLCAAAAAFFLKFLIALGQESRRECTCYLVRLHCGPDDDVPAEASESQELIPGRYEHDGSSRREL